MYIYLGVVNAIFGAFTAWGITIVSAVQAVSDTDLGWYAPATRSELFTRFGPLLKSYGR